MSITKNFGYNLLLQISNLIFPLISFPYISRILGPEGLGVVNFAQSFAQYFVTLSALGIPIYGIREIAKLGDDKTHRSKLFSEIFVIHTISMCIALVVYVVVVLSVSRFSAYLSLHLWAAAFVVFAVLPIEWLFSGVSDFAYITKRALIIRCLSILGLFVFVKTKDDVLPYMLISIASSSLNAVFNLYHARNYVSFCITGLQFSHHVKPLMLIYGSTLAISIYVQLNTIMLGFMSGDAAVGFYTAAVRVSKLPLGIVAALGGVLVPQISLFVAQDDWEKVYAFVDKSFSFICLVCTPIAVGMVLYAYDIILIFSGQSFVDAAFSLQCMSPLVLVIGLSNLFGIQLLTPMRKDKALLYTVLGGTVLNFCINLWLIPNLRQDGASLATLFAEILVTFLMGCYVFKYTMIRFDWIQLLKAFTASIPFILVAYIYHQSLDGDVWLLIASIILCALIYIVIQYFVFKNKILSDSGDFIIKQLTRA